MQSSAPADGQNNCPKHVELTGIINKPLLLDLVGRVYYLYQWCTVKQISGNEIYLLIKYIKSVIWRVRKCLSCTEDARCLKVNIEVFVFEEVWRNISESFKYIYIFFFQVKFLEFKVQNIVGTCDLRFPIRVENLNQMHGQFSRCVFIGWKVLLWDKSHLHTIQKS